jgi:thioesterase domain-containing protein/acyl carrier protein
MLSNTETIIVDHWKEILGLDHIEANDDFFILGGDSITVLQLVAKIKSSFGLSLNASSILKNPTVIKLANLIENESHSTDSKEDLDILCMQKGYSDNHIPLVLIHAADGEVYIYSNLVNSMPDRFTIHAIRSPLLKNKKDFDSIEDMAEYYVLELEKIGINPPYFIGGSSFGGVVAYHMGQILAKKGFVPPTIISIDAPAYTNLPDAFDEDILIIEYLNKYMFPQLQIKNEVIRNLNSTEEQIDYILTIASQLNKRDIFPDNFGASYIKTWRKQQQIMNYYIAEPYDGSMIFFSHSEITPEFPTDQALEWKKLVRGKFTDFKIPGNHSSMNSAPNVQNIANYLTKIMDDY